MAEIDYATASQLFDTEVTQRYQNKQALAGTIEERHGTVGEATNIPVSDIVEMTQQSFAPTDIAVTPVNPTNVMVVPYNYALKTVIGGGEKTLFNYSKIVDHAKTHAKASARMVDYIKINAIYSNPDLASFPKVPYTVGPDTGLNAAKLISALSMLEATGVDVQDYNVSLWIPAVIKGELLNDEKVVNLFYNSQRPLGDGSWNRPRVTYLGIDIRTLGSNGINQIPYTTAAGTDTYLVPLVAHDAMVQIFNRDVETRIVWRPDEDRWVLLSVLTSGAQVVQESGIVMIEVKSPAVANP